MAIMTTWTGTKRQRIAVAVIYQASKCLAVFALVMLAVFGIQWAAGQPISTPAPAGQFHYTEVTDQFNVAESSNNWAELRNAYTACARLNTASDQIGACQQDAYILATTPKGK